MSLVLTNIQNALAAIQVTTQKLAVDVPAAIAAAAAGADEAANQAAIDSIATAFGAVNDSLAQLDTSLAAHASAPAAEPAPAAIAPADPLPAV